MPLIARSLARAGVTVDVATTDDDGPGGRVNMSLGKRVERDGYGVFYFRKQTEFYKVSLPFKRWMNEHATEYDVVHVHALFSYTSNCAARVAPRARVPYVVRPLGVLNRWGMENRRPFIKALSFRFVEQPILRNAAAVHYTSRQEQRQAEDAGVRARGVVIPLGVDVTQFQKLPDAAVFLKRFPEAAGRPIVLFLSRIDPVKGLDLLLPAFGKARERHPDALLAIAGGGGANYIAQLQEQVRRLGIGGAVLWAGRLEGELKLAALAAATAFVLPSYSENYGVALVEALAAGLPCVTTEGVAVSDDVREQDAGIVVRAEMEPLSEALDRLLGDAALRSRLGANARRLAAERFSVEAMGNALQKLYESICLPGRTRTV